MRSRESEERAHLHACTPRTESHVFWPAFLWERKRQYVYYGLLSRDPRVVDRAAEQTTLSRGAWV